MAINISGDLMAAWTQSVGVTVFINIFKTHFFERQLTFPGTGEHEVTSWFITVMGWQGECRVFQQEETKF